MARNFSDSSSNATDEVWQNLINSDSDEELEMLAMVALKEKKENAERRTRVHCNSIQSRRNIDRGRIKGHNRLYNDYFAEDPVYTQFQFRRRFRMSRSLFLRIVNAVKVYDSYFVQKRNSDGRLGLPSLQKVTAAMMILAYGVVADVVDDYMRIAESTLIELLKRFVQAVVDVFGNEYLRKPNNVDITRLLSEGVRRGFPGMMGSIDYMTCFFGLPGSHNDINVLDRSPLFADLAEGRAPPVNYSINGHDYTMGYYLADGIYYAWAIFVKTILCPQGSKAKKFATAQESTRKDVERAFGVLQARFAIVRGPTRFWDRETLQQIMKACVIMHNMIVKDERDENLPLNYDAREGDSGDLVVSHDDTNEFQDFIQNYLCIRDRGTHSQLQANLVEHLWQRQGGDSSM